MLTRRTVSPSRTSLDGVHAWRDRAASRESRVLPVSIPGLENLSPAIKYVIAFAIIFVLLALFALILRRLTGGRMSMTSERGRARQPRLGIVDVYDLDRQRQLILLRRDNVEHLLLVGGPNDVVVETNIVRVPGARLPSAASEAGERIEPGPDRNVEIAPVRPVVEPGLGRGGGRARDNVVGAHLGASEALAAIAGPASDTSREPLLKPTRVSAAPQPAGAQAQRPQSPPPRAGTPQPNGGDRPGMADMARQLEVALRGPPVPSMRPPPDAPRPAPDQPPRAGPDAPRPRPAPEPGPAPTAAPAFRPRPPEPAPKAALPAPPRPEPAPRPPASPAQPTPPPAAPQPAPPSPSPPPAQAASPPAPTPPGPVPPPAPAASPATIAAPASPPKPDPFSIEDIEAEFARLLGRPLDKKE